MTDKPVLFFYTFRFVVRAKDFNEAAKILNDSLGIETRHDAGEREINSLYLISCRIEEKKLTKSFYEKIANSEDIAIHSDEKSAKLYPEILKETQAVEEKLRWLLLHVSDAIDNFAEQFRKKKGPQQKNEIISKKSLDPITSTLSFEAMMELLSLDQSWARNGVTVDQMRLLMDSSVDFADFKKSYIEKTTKNTTWDSISSIVLQTSVSWDSLKDKLEQIRGYRNSCAHFRTVTDDDLSQAQNLRKKLDEIFTIKKIRPQSYSTSLRTLNEQLAQTLKAISQSFTSGINSSALAAVSSQIDALKLSQDVQRIVKLSIPTDAILRATRNMTPRLDLPNLSQIFNNTIPHINLPNPSRTFIDSIGGSLNLTHGLYGLANRDEDEKSNAEQDNNDKNSSDIKPDDDQKSEDDENTDKQGKKK